MLFISCIKLNTCLLSFNPTLIRAIHFNPTLISGSVQSTLIQPWSVQNSESMTLKIEIWFWGEGCEMKSSKILKSFFCPLLLSVSLSLFLSRLNSFARISCIWKYCLKENIICRKLPLFRFRNCKKKTKNVKTIANRQNYLGGKMFNQTSTILIDKFSLFYC